MITPAPMKKMRMLVFEDYIDDVVKELEKSRNLHLIDLHETALEEEVPFGPSDVQPTLQRYSKLKDRIGGIMDALDMSPPESEEVEAAGKSLEAMEAKVEEIEGDVLSISSEVEKSQESLSNLENLRKSVSKLSAIGVEPETLQEQEFISVVAGQVTSENLSGLKRRAEDVCEGHQVIVSDDVSAEMALVAVATLKKYEDDLEKTISIVGFERFVLPPDLPGGAKEALEELSQEIESKVRRISNLKEKLSKIKEERFQEICEMHKVVRAEINRFRAKEKFAETDRVKVIEGWVPEKNEDELLRKARKASNGYCTIETQYPEEVGTEVPVLLENPRILKPFEGILRSHSIPRYEDIDPTLFIAVMFPILYGFMFPDLGHGIILIGIGLSFTRVKKLGNIVESLLGYSAKGIGKILIAGGAISIVTGVLFGEAFGFSEATAKVVLEATGRHAPVLVPHFWVDIIKSGKFVFAVTLLVGFIHLFSGEGLRLIKGLKSKEYSEIVEVPLSIWCLIGAFYFLLIIVGDPFGLTGGFSLQKLFIFIPAPIIGLIVYGIFADLPELRKATGIEKILVPLRSVIDAVFGKFFRFIANIVSYGRILAMMISHAVFMQVAVILTFMVLGMPGGIVLGPAIFLLFTIIVILLEAVLVMIQNVRLFFYEWFTKFYEGGGIEFSPFSPIGE